MFEVLREVVSAMAEGKAVTIAPIHQQLTTQEVADFLRIRRPALIELLETGQIPFEHVGRHRRVRLIDALEYQRTRSKRQSTAWMTGKSSMRSGMPSALSTWIPRLTRRRCWQSGPTRPGTWWRSSGLNWRESCGS
ncbi:MAG: helix-turn-helix domain-containing protein [Acidimicrobiia bacterium]|nr:helix-turn-helix domain-containing protein [Acidimicrobiia bacterium]